MKHPALRCTAAALLLSGVCSTYAADPYWYTGLGVGYSRVQFYPADFKAGVAGVDESKKEFDAGFKGFLGYQINRNWAAEVSYVSVGKFQYKYTDTTANVTQLDDYKVTGWGFSALPTVPLTNNFSFYGRLGAFFSQARITFYNVGFVVGNNGVGVLGGKFRQGRQRMHPQRCKLFRPGQCEDDLGQRYFQILSAIQSQNRETLPVFCFGCFLFGRRYRPRSFQSRSTRFFTSACIAIGRPQTRRVSAGHLLVASIPIFDPSPATGLAKSR